MSDQPQYRNDQATQPMGQYGVEDPPWARTGTTRRAQLVRLERPIYTGMLLGFGLMVAGMVFVVIVVIVLGILGAVLSGTLLAPNL